MSHAVRKVDDADLEPLATLWHDGWHEAHAGHVPAGLTRIRTRDRFLTRLAALDDTLRTAGPVGDPLGLVAIKGDELYQLFVDPRARGTGLAAALLAEGETMMAAAGVARAHLLCVIENTRAAAFYHINGWELIGVRRDRLDTESGPFEFDMLRLEKTLIGRTPG